MTQAAEHTPQLDTVAQDEHIVALHLREHLLPVEGANSVFFPPTYAGGGYQTNTLSDGTMVVEVDSVGSQANRMEPIFLRDELRHLVPQVEIEYGDPAKANDGRISLLEAGHRLGDAVVRSTELGDEAREAFQSLLRSGDATKIAKLAPTSLVFGVWDSRDTMAKVPRLLQASIRAFDVSELRRSAQFTPALDYAELEVFSDAERAKAEGKASSPLAERGFVHVPAIGTHGGVIASGPIIRDVTINLVQLRRLQGQDAQALRRYLFGLALVAAAEPLDPFLRQGCLLVPSPGAEGGWTAVRRDGTRGAIELTPVAARAYAEAAAKAFGVGPERSVKFDKKRAAGDTKKKSK